MKLQLAYYGDQVLRKKAARIDHIDDALMLLIKDMTETMEAHRGCGLAAPQVHQSIALFITRIPKYSDGKISDPGEIRVFMNTKIISYSKEIWACEEGCLSIPELKATVARPKEVVFEYMNLKGEICQETFIDFDAHVMMHENDHVYGVLYIDRLSEKEKRAMEPTLRKIKKKLSAEKRG